jgi:hypothetical protein
MLLIATTKLKIIGKRLRLIENVRKLGTFKQEYAVKK